jgi:dTDP-4-amino-4,6-dideoxygalactose transaminase
MSQLAIKGGTPVRSRENLFPAHSIFGEEEKRAVNEVLDTGGLSKFIGAWCDQFYGGEQVQAFEREWGQRFGATHVVSMNSATSGLIAAIGALGIGPGDEVIVTPFSMSVSATTPIWYGAVPVFADVERNFFCLDPKSIEAVITPRTKAIIVVDIIGLPYDAEAINSLAKKHGIAVIEDAAQAPGAVYKGKHAGTLADIGVYSLNFHKHIHTGEGALVVTDNPALAERLQLIRNHAEAVVEVKGVEDLTNMVGFNFRLTELQAAIGREQLKKFDRLLQERQKNCTYINELCLDMPGIKPAEVRPDCTHAYYQHPFVYNKDEVGVSRSKFLTAVMAELPPTAQQEEEGTLLYEGTERPPLYHMPIFQKKIAIGRYGFPFVSPQHAGTTSYEKGLCPVAEELWNTRLFSHDMMRPGMSQKDLNDVIEAFHKVYTYRKELEA